MPSIYVQPSAFDSRVMGRRIGTATISHSPDEGCNEQPYDLLCSKVSSNDFDSVSVLKEHGFHYVEGEIDLEVELESTISIASATDIRQATLNDLEDLRTLAAGSMRGLTRLRGPWFTTEESDKMYETWIENAVKGLYDHACLIMPV